MPTAKKVSTDRRVASNQESGFVAARVYGRVVGGAWSKADMQKNDGSQSDHVAQASGMVSVQAHCTVVQAFTMIEERADLIDLTMEEVADSVLDRRLRFSAQSDAEGFDAPETVIDARCLSCGLRWVELGRLTVCPECESRVIKGVNDPAWTHKPPPTE